MKIKPLFTFVAVLLLIGLTTACSLLPQSGGEQTQPTQGSGEVVRDLARVESIEIVMLGSSPAQVSVRASGNLPDNCTSLAETTQIRDGQTFTISIFTNRPRDGVCTLVVEPFEVTAPLDVTGLGAGQYSVNVNGVWGSFDLAAGSTNGASVSGLVWHDLCAVGGGEGGAALVPSAGCVAFENTYRANGALEFNEPGLSGVRVRLGPGNCLSGGLAETTTDSNGNYSFSGLEPGTYCISVDALDTQNNPILVPGAWTYPALGAGMATTSAAVQLNTGENKTGLNFGWDYQFLPVAAPVPTPTPAPTATPAPTPTPIALCDWAQFVADVTVPDYTPYSPGSSFVKTWRIKNVGTCSWTSDYDLIFVNGNAMTDKVISSLPGTIMPGQTVDLSVQMVAPTQVGNYKGSWMLRNRDGKLFGLGSQADKPFWALIKVILPNNQFVYDFAANYCLANWKSDSGKLPCPGSTSSTNGFVIMQDNPKLENKNENERTLWLRPNHDPDGWISGVYPAIQVQKGDHFKAWVGCLADSPSCNVTFTLGYRSAGGASQETRITWDEIFDGLVTVVDIDLSSLANNWMIFTLSAEINNRQYGDANAFWFAPRIENADYSAEDSGYSAAAVQAAKKMIAAALSISTADLNFIRVEGPVTWGTTCLDVQLTNVTCLPASIPGYRVIFQYSGGKYEAHTSLDGSVVYWFYAGPWK
jgi:hypothetical protein